MKKGYWYGVAAYGLWGLFPVYFKWLKHVPSLEVVGHRVLWSCVLLGFVILASRQWRGFRAHALTLKSAGLYSVAAALIGANWLIWVWAVNSGYIVEASLGYFITPLLNVFLGVVFLRERLRPWQWVSIGMATIGVLYLTVAHGSLPWIALGLAFAFALYGLVKKLAPLSSLHGLTLETAILFLPALLYLVVVDRMGDGAFYHTDLMTDLLLIGAGLVTTVPLLLFASAARSIPLSGLGVLQYIAPTLQFLLGVWVYGEPFTRTQLVGFAIVWAALVVFVIEGWYTHRAQPVLVE
jgi:chloramphenicol-sensitive protein RarD